MSFRWMMAAGAVLATAGCVEPGAIKGATDDGETITGLAKATGFYDVSGVMQLTGNRGLSCTGLFVYEGLMGPKGTVTLTCNNGQSGEAALVGVTAGTGDGYIGSRKIHFTWGRA
jgi:hypothetical protein